MSETLKKAGVCPHCGAPLKTLAPDIPGKAPDPSIVLDPAKAFFADFVRYDLESLAAEALQEKAFDESARVRVTQQDIRQLLEKRRKGRK
jgi:hypothetical protein